jgi:hypothetical protein
MRELSDFGDIFRKYEGVGQMQVAADKSYVWIEVTNSGW